jgi:hypothetical protein
MSNMIQPCPDYSKFVDWVKLNFDMHLNSRDYYFIDKVLRIRSYAQAVALASYSPQEWLDHLGPDKYATFLPNIANLAIILDLTISNDPISWQIYLENIEHCYDVKLEDYETYNKVKVSVIEKSKNLKPAPEASMPSKPPAYVKVSPAVQHKGDIASLHSKKKNKTKPKVYRSSSPKQIDSNGNPDPGDSSSSSSDTRHPKRSKKSKEDDESDNKDSNGNYYEDMPGHGDYKSKKRCITC